MSARNFFKAASFLVMALLVINFPPNANALDVSACANFPHQWGPNITCLGKLEMGDMGSFGGGAWAWNTDFANNWNGNNYSPIFSLSEIIPRINDNINITDGRLDNRRHTNGITDSRIVIKGMINGVILPSIWKMKVDAPNNNPGAWVGPPTANYPITIYHTDWFKTPQCSAANAPSSCWDDKNNDNRPDGYAGPIMNVVGGEALGVDNVASVSLNGYTATPYYVEADYNRSLSWNAGNNSFTVSGTYVDTDTLYFHPFPALIPKGGPYDATLTLTDSRTKILKVNVQSDRVMPTISAFTENPNYVEVKNNGKLKDPKTSKTVVNMSAHPDIYGQLIIQWTVPELAFQPPAPNTGGIRLRVFVGEGWETEGIIDEKTLTFLFIDTPVISGNIVVPADQWTYIKGKMRESEKNYVEIAGMYREQFGFSIADGTPYLGYHNRGYTDMVKFQFE